MFVRLIEILGAGRQAAPDGGGDVMPQVGAAPYVLENGVPVFLLVTTRRTARWIFPKGGCRPGESPAMGAGREALEEAGVEGEVDPTPLGVYRDRKRAAPDIAIDVALYPLRVTRQHDDWAEKRLRQRHWATLAEARKLITTPGLIGLMEQADMNLRIAAR